MFRVCDGDACLVFGAFEVDPVLDWWRVSCMLRGMARRPQEDKSAQKARPSFGDVVNKNGFDDQYGHLPGQLGDKSRDVGANSVAASPTFRGEFREEVAQQCDYRMPMVSD